MFKKYIAIILAVCVFWIGIPVYAGSENVAKDVWDMTGLQIFWEGEEPNEAGLNESFRLEITPADEKHKHYLLKYMIQYSDAEGYSIGYRYFTANIPDGEFAFNNNAGDTLEFTATLTGLTEFMEYHYGDDDGGDEGDKEEDKYAPMTDDGEDEGDKPEVIEETKHFDLHAVIHEIGRAHV